jgi:SAM-dependent methyltransferase
LSTPLLYGELVDWYRLLDRPEDHADEVAAFVAALAGATRFRAETLLELGAGAGHNALHYKDRFQSTLVDLSPEMIRLSRELNPGCEHLAGDMRTLRLGRAFDAVLVHDAITYMTTESDLRAAIETAFVHTRPGGAAVFAPDAFRETFTDEAELVEADAGARSMRGVIWSWDPDPSDTTSVTEYGLLLREGEGVRMVHDRHVEGLFPMATWRALLGGAGYEVATFARPIGDGDVDEVFLCRRRDSHG